MSYILNALRKAECERRQARPHQIDDLLAAGWDPVSDISPRSGSRWIWSFSVALPLLLVLAILVLNRIWSTTPGATSAAAPAENIVPAGGQASVVADEAAVSVQAPEQYHGAVDAVTNAGTAGPDGQASAQVAPDLDVEGHVYVAAGSRLNRVFVAGASYRQGDFIDSRWRILDIMADRMVVAEGRREYVVGLKR